MNARVILAGGSGFIGQALIPLLHARGYEPVVLTRGKSRHECAADYVQWDARTLGPWADVIDGAAAIINLTGRSINTRHTPEHRRQILESRVDSVRVLGQALAKASTAPKVFIQASGVGFYGDTGDRACDESCPPGHDFPAEVCREWEQTFRNVECPETRKVIFRVGVVLGRDNGFLSVLGKITRAFLGGRVGSGKQFISWIHISDLCSGFADALERADLTDVFNATAPEPVTNARFMEELRRALNRPWSPPVPVFAAKIGSRLLGTEASLALTSQRAVPKRLLEAGFQFDFPDLPGALAHIYSKS